MGSWLGNFRSRPPILELILTAYFTIQSSSPFLSSSWVPTVWSWLIIPFLISVLSSSQNVISLVTHPSRLNRIYILFLFYWLPVTLFHYSPILNTVGELLPMAYIWPTACFCMACRLRTAFTLFKWLNKNQKQNISWHEKLHEIPFHCTHFVCDYFCAQHSWVVETDWLSKCKILFGLFAESADSSPYLIGTYGTYEYHLLWHLGALKSLSIFNRLPFKNLVFIFIVLTESILTCRRCDFCTIVKFFH